MLQAIDACNLSEWEGSGGLNDGVKKQRKQESRKTNMLLLEQRQTSCRILLEPTQMARKHSSCFTEL